ncbi:hypothetical protein AVEN_237853-1 [Araneus ventricosus]|uniref:Uncharacterized protein n=1 Tax=Araneus ventricosus TaxID=182803 RepID=A0A4Y2P4K7_ARAVE|nr:hypothetical protein AVEN_237853-1 [Araneus ventricosus]
MISCAWLTLFLSRWNSRQWFDNNDIFHQFTALQEFLEQCVLPNRLPDARLRDCYNHLTQQIGGCLNRSIQECSLCAGKLILPCQKTRKWAFMKSIIPDSARLGQIDEFVKRCREIESLRRRCITRT